MKYKSCGSYCKISRINHEENWKKQKQKKVSNREEIGKGLMTFCRKQQDGSKRANYTLQKTIRMQMEACTLLDKRANYTLQKTIRMHMEAWTLLDGGSRLYALIHEARIRRELIL
jgi:hypothetical protein